MENRQSKIHGRITDLGPSNRCILTWNGKDNVVLFDSQSQFQKFEKEVKKGDLIQFTGKQNELEFYVREWKLLHISKGLAQFDFKKVYEKQKLWESFLTHVREFFGKNDFIHIRTPSVVNSSGVETHVNSILTSYKFNSGNIGVLPTSPELHLKRILSCGFDKIYEIRECFRDDIITRLHRPSFKMVEWYRSFSTLEEIQRDVVLLIEHLVKSHNLNFKINIEKYTLRDLFEKHLDFSLYPDTSLTELKKCAQNNGVFIGGSYTWTEAFDLLFLEKIEPLMDPSLLIFISDFPPQSAALSEINNEGWSHRTEVFWKKKELGNGYQELVNPKEQEFRLKRDREAKISEGKWAPPVDEDFISALKYGIPPSAGIAMGLERLFMSLFDYDSIDDVLIF